jgi:hypothetical protein
VHVPHGATVRDVPQLSAAVTLPQFFPTRVQNAASVSPTQPQTLADAAPHTCGDVHVPHDVTVRDVPQLSAAVTAPQFFPTRAQNAWSVSAAQPHTFAVPPPAQLCGNVHVPQIAVRAAPQLSLAVTLPQFLLWRVQNAVSVSAAQPHTFAAPPPPHVWGAAHVPQIAVRETAQLSAAVTLPQFLLWRVQNAVSVSAVQPHTLLPPHVWGAVHVPQDSTVRAVAQLSAAVTLPQFLLWRTQNAASVSAVQVHTLPAPHVWGAAHVPQETVRFAPQLSDAATFPQFLASRLQKAWSASAVQPHTFAVPPPPHVLGDEHVPHETTVRLAPQLSEAVTLPQFLPSLVQSATSVSAVQPQTLAAPPPPQVTPVPLHAPHEATVRFAPQLSDAVTLPQFLPSLLQNATSVSAVQPQTLAAPPPPHAWGAVHVPHDATARGAPQLSFAVTLPQFFPRRAQNAVSVSAAQPHTFAAPLPAHV